MAFLVKLLLRKGFSSPPPHPFPISNFFLEIMSFSSKECGPLIEHFKSRSLRVLGAKFGRNRLQVLWKSYRKSHSWLMITRKTYLNLWWFWAILRWAEINCECVPCNLKNFKIATAWALQTKLYKTHLLPQDISEISINLFSGQTTRSSI